MNRKLYVKLQGTKPVGVEEVKTFIVDEDKLIGEVADLVAQAFGFESISPEIDRKNRTFGSFTFYYKNMTFDRFTQMKNLPANQELIM